MRNSFSVCCLLVAIIYCNSVLCYKILGILPTIAKSHYSVGKLLMRELAAEGHEVTVVAPYKAEDKPANYNEIYVDKLVERFQNGNFQHFYISIRVI